MILSTGCDNPNIVSAEQRDSLRKAIEDSTRVADSIAEIQRHIEDSIAEASKTYWDYREETDQFSGKTSYLAILASSNSVNFDFPYNGGSVLYLGVRKHPQYGNDVYIKISSGQFNSSAFDGATIKVKFDDGPTMNFRCNNPADYSMDCLFISGYSRFVNQLKKAKKCIIQAPFYQEGDKTFEFVVQNFEWNH